MTSERTSERSVAYPGTVQAWLLCLLFLKMLLFPSQPSDNVMEEIQNKLQDIRHPMAAMMVLLREMDLETDSEFGGDGSAGPGRTLELVVRPVVVETFSPGGVSIQV